MKLLGWQWPLVWWSTYDQVLTENHSLRNHLVETQKALLKHKLLLADLGNGNKDVEAVFERAKAAARAGKS